MNSRKGKDISWIHCNGKDISQNLKGGVLKIHMNQVYLNSSRYGEITRSFLRTEAPVSPISNTAIQVFSRDCP